MAPRNEIGHEMVVLSEAASSRIASGEGASRPALLPFPGVHLGVRVVSPRLRGKRAKRPRPRHGDLNAPGASQSIESCKHEAAAPPPAVLLPVSDSLSRELVIGRRDYIW